MRVGRMMHRLGRIGSWLGAAFLMCVVLLFLDAERFGGRYLNWLEGPLARLIVGDDPNGHGDQSYVFFYGAILLGILVCVSLLVMIVGRALERRSAGQAAANAG